MGALKEGRMTREEAKKKLGALRENGKERRIQEAKTYGKAWTSGNVKNRLAEIKAEQKKLHESMKAKLANLEKVHPKENEGKLKNQSWWR